MTFAVNGFGGSFLQWRWERCLLPTLQQAFELEITVLSNKFTRIFAEMLFKFPTEIFSIIITYLEGYLLY